MEYGNFCLCQLVKHVEYHGIQSHIGVPSLICDILSVQKKYIVTCDDEINDAPCLLTLSYILNVGKYVDDIVIPIYAHVLDEEMLITKP